MPWGSRDFILGHKTALGEVQIGNTPFVQEQDISSLKDINSHWVKESENVALVGKKHFIWSLKQKTYLGDA